MKLRPIVPLILITIFASCTSSTEFTGERRSNASIGFTLGGRHVVMSDSILPGDPGIQTMTASYYEADSMATILAHSGFGDNISFTLQTPLDTGTILVRGTGRAPLTFFPRSGFVSLRAGNGAYVSDSTRTGSMHITEFDSASRQISGTFRIWVIHELSGTTGLDTLLVDDGVLSLVPISISR